MKNHPPTHVAIIMDGNRRWAKQKGLDPTAGHKAGVDTLENTVKTSIEMGVKYLTVYALSTENLGERSKFEIAFLFSLIEKGVKEKLSMLAENGVRIKFIGDIRALPDRLQTITKNVQKELLKNKKLTLIIALNYGGRHDIVQAVRKVGKNTGEIMESDITENLYTEGVPDPDLVIRTGGQKRLSNFLLWQTSYSELYFTDTLWPDFGKKEFQKALKDYSVRKRNFGR